MTSITPKFVLLVAVTLLIYGCDSNSGDGNPGEEFDLIGTWEGVVTQAGFGTYLVSMEIDLLQTGKRAGSIDYPQLNCSGTLTYDGNSSGVYIFNEQIDIGQEICLGPGRIEIEETDSRKISWEWYFGGSEPLVTGTLTKK